MRLPIHGGQMTVKKKKLDRRHHILNTDGDMSPSFVSKCAKTQRYHQSLRNEHITAMQSTCNTFLPPVTMTDGSMTYEKLILDSQRLDNLLHEINLDCTMQKATAALKLLLLFVPIFL